MNQYIVNVLIYKDDPAVRTAQAPIVHANSATEAMNMVLDHYTDQGYTVLDESIRDLGPSRTSVDYISWYPEGHAEDFVKWEDELLNAVPGEDWDS